MLAGFVPNSGLKQNLNSSFPFGQAALDKQLSNFACLGQVLL